VIKTNVQVSTSITYIRRQNPVLAQIQPTTTVIEDFPENTVVSAIYEVNGQKERVVTIVNKVTQEVTVVEDVKITQEIKGTTLITNKQDDGKVVVVSNDVETIAVVNPQVRPAIVTIKEQFPEIQVEKIKTIEATEMTQTSEIKIIAQTEKKITEQISVSIVKETGEVRVTDVQVISLEQTIVMPKPLPIIEVLPTAPEIVTILPQVEEIQKDVFQGTVEVTKSTIKETSVGSVITMEVKNTKQEVFSVTVQIDVKGTVTVLDSRPIGQPERIIEVPIEPKTTAITVNKKSGVRTTFSVSVDVKEEIKFVPEPVKIEQCTAVGVQETEYQNVFEQVILTKCTDRCMKTTVLITKPNSNTNGNTNGNTNSNTEPQVIAEEQIPLEDCVKAPVVEEVTFTKEEFTSEIKTNTVLQHSVQYVEKQNPVLVGITPVDTVVDTIGESVKTTLVYEVNEKIERVVTIENTVTQEVTIIEDTQIEEIKSVAVTTDVTEQGYTVVTSNSVEEIKIVNPKIEFVFEEVQQVFPIFKPEQIETIQTTEMTETSQVTIVAEVEVGVKQQFTANVNQQTGAVQIIDTQVLPPVMIKPVRPPCVVVPPTEYIKPEVMEVVSLVQTQQTSIVGVSTSVQEVQVKQLKNAQIYTVVLQNPEGQKFTSSITKDKKTGVTQVLDVREVRETTVTTTTTTTIKKSVTITKVDEHTGVTTVQTTDPVVIQESPKTQTVLQYIQQQNPELKNCRVESTETREYESNYEETVLYICEEIRGVQETVIVDKQTQTTEIIGHQEITINVHQEEPLLPVIHENTISQSTYQTFVTADVCLQKTVSALAQKNPELTGATPEFTSVEDLHRFKKYTFVFDVQGTKERLVAMCGEDYTIRVVEKIKVPAVIKPITTIVKTNEKGEVSQISNNIQEVRKTDTKIDLVLEEIRHSHAFLSETNIEGIQTKDLTGATQYTVLIKNQEGKDQQVTVNYKHKSESMVIIDDQVFPRVTEEFIAPIPRPVVEITEKELKSEKITKIVDYLTEQKPSPFQPGTVVKSAKAISISFGQRYELEVQTPKGETYVINVDKDQTNDQIKLVDVATPMVGLPVLTEVQVNEVTGVTKTVTSSKVAIEANQEYTKIRDFLQTQHGELTSDFEVESTSEITYMRSIEETLIFRRGDQVIQSTVLVDKRNKAVIELDFKVITEELAPDTVELPKSHPEIHIAQQEFSHVAETNPIIERCIDYAEKTDFTLKGKIPQETILEDFKLVKKITFIFKTEVKTDRIVLMYDVKDERAKVIDLGTVDKDIKDSKTIIKNDIKGNVIVTSSNVVEVQRTNPQFPNIVKNITGQYSYLNGYEIKTVELGFRKVTQQPIQIGSVSFGSTVSQGVTIAPGVQKGDLFQGQITFVNSKGVIVQVGFDRGVSGQTVITTLQEKSI